MRRRLQWRPASPRTIGPDWKRVGLSCALGPAADFWNRYEEDFAHSQADGSQRLPTEHRVGPRSALNFDRGRKNASDLRLVPLWTAMLIGWLPVADTTSNRSSPSSTSLIPPGWEWMCGWMTARPPSSSSSFPPRCTRQSPTDRDPRRASVAVVRHHQRAEYARHQYVLEPPLSRRRPSRHEGRRDGLQPSPRRPCARLQRHS